MIAILKFAKIGYFSEFIFFLSYFPIRRKVSKGTTKGKRDCDLPLSFGNLSPSNACFCYHSGQSAASQTCSAPLAAIEFKRCCGSNSAVFHVPKIRSCFLSEFSTSRSGLTRAFFLLSGASFFFLFRKKGRKMRKNSLKFKLNIRLNQI